MFPISISFDLPLCDDCEVTPISTGRQTGDVHIQQGLLICYFLLRGGPV